MCVAGVQDEGAPEPPPRQHARAVDPVGVAAPRHEDARRLLSHHDGADPRLQTGAPPAPPRPASSLCPGHAACPRPQLSLICAGGLGAKRFGPPVWWWFVTFGCFGPENDHCFRESRVFGWIHKPDNKSHVRCVFFFSGVQRHPEDPPRCAPAVHSHQHRGHQAGV